MSSSSTSMYPSAITLMGLLMPFCHGGAAFAASAESEQGGKDCAALANTDFSTIQDAPTQIMSVKVVDKTLDLPAYCEVLGYITPNVGIELRLPTPWNGKFLHIGCGGWCGYLLDKISYGYKNEQIISAERAEACDEPLRKGYACMVNDSGHKSTITDVKWAYNNWQAEIDYAYRATHVAAVAGKVLVQHYYDQAPRRAYFMGGSGGGREGLLEAQRFPWDFDGIVVGAPAINVTGGVMRLLWNALATVDATGHPLLSESDVRLVHNAAIERCDRDDGLKDGIIGNPRTCQFDPAELLCGRAPKSACLSAAQVTAIKKIYGGPVSSQGEKLYTGGDLPGSELEWILAPEAWSDFFRYMAFVPDPGPGWKAADFDFNRDPKRLGMMESLFSATNPDLRKFKAAGGKLIANNGWADHFQAGTNIIDYYETVERTMGGRAQTQDFFRLFMLPGVAHGAGGAGADTVDYLAYLDAWVEQGRAPDRIISARLKGDTPNNPSFPLDPTKVQFTRPVYPYPLHAKYIGRGDVNNAENFSALEPK